MGDGLLRILYCLTDAFNRQFDPKQFKEEMKKQPRLLICSPEFLGSSEVHKFTEYLH